MQTLSDNRADRKWQTELYSTYSLQSLYLTVDGFAAALFFVNCKYNIEMHTEYLL
jgi:hypothetical protein